MAIYNNVEYLTLPQQVEKNKDDIVELQALRQIYNNGDTLPTPAVGTSNTYIVVVTKSSDEGLLAMSLGAVTLTNPSIVTISNANGILIVYSNPGQAGAIVPNLLLNADYISLLRLI